MSYATDLNRTVRRLEGSAGRRVARRNALRELDTLLKRIRRELRRKYPSVGKDGQEITPVLLKRGERKCPLDGAYVPTPGAFAKHLVEKHDGKCWCGFLPSWWESFKHGTMIEKRRVKYDPRLHGEMYSAANKKAIASLRGHFTRVKDNLTSHLVYGAIKELDKLAEAKK